MAVPLKILILGQDPDLFERPGGAPNDTRERHLAYVRELQRRRPGSEVRIAVHTRGPGANTFERPFDGLQIHGTNSRSRLAAPWDLLGLVRRFKREGWVPDVVSCQTGYEEGLVAYLARLPGTRVQIQVHSDFYGAAFTRHSPIRRLIRWGIRAAIRRADHVRVVSRGIERALVESGDIEAARITVAPVPVVFVGDPPASDPLNPVVLFVGRLVPEKDLGLWCEVAHRLHARTPTARFWIVGDGPERATVERSLGEFGDAVTLFGSVAYAQLAPIFARASLFLFTSRYEGLGRVVVESMMAGVPVVSANIVGPQDLIEDRRTGRLVERDADRLAAACLELLDDPAQAQNMARAAQDWARAHFAFDAVVLRIVESWEAAAAISMRRG